MEQFYFSLYFLIETTTTRYTLVTMDNKKIKLEQLNKLYAPLRSCTGCHFNMPKATQIVFGEGNPDSPLVFIGEAPGQEEDITGRPFVGRSGKLLTKLLEAYDVQRSDIFITNIVKIRPPNNRKPTPQEITQSKPLLIKQLEIINPKVICTLGAAALEGLLGHPVQITNLRGKPFKWGNMTVIPTYHPAFILRNQTKLEPLALDIKKAIDMSFSR